MNVEPIGWVRNSRIEPIEYDAWDSVVSTVTLDKTVFDADSLRGLLEFTHVEVVYVFDRDDPNIAMTPIRHPRGNRSWPEVGIFAQRGPGRPNRIGSTICRLDGIVDVTLTLTGLDAIDGTPVIDIKPWVEQLGARGTVGQPAWATELMSKYW